MNKLEPIEQLDRTFFTYTSYHGIEIGRYELQGKQNLYEHTWRVPMNVRGPEIKRGVRTTGNV